MFKTLNRRLPILICLIGYCLYSHSQMINDTSRKKDSNTYPGNPYCYYPSDPQKVSHNGTINFYVSSPPSKESGNIEFLIYEVGKKGPEIGGISFTIDGTYDNGKGIKYSWVSNNTVRINLADYMTGKDHLSVYLNRVTPSTGIEYAGPITFASSQNECDYANKNVSDTAVKWSFRKPYTMSVNSGGPKNEVLSRELKNVSLLPTDGMISLLERLNPGLSSKREIDPGYAIILPKFPEPDQIRENRLEAQFSRDVSVDPVQNSIFRERSKFLTMILKAIDIPDENKEVTNDLSWINNILLKLQNSKVGLKKNQTDLINNEIENFYIFLIEDFSRNGVTEESALYIHGFRDYLNQVLRSPVSKTRVKPVVTENGGPHIETDHLWDEDQSVEFPEDPLEGYLKVYVYAFENEYSAPLDGYFVYSISQFQHDRLAAKKRDITMSDLATITTRCQDMASIASRELDPTFTYYFIAVLPSTGAIVMCNKVDLRTLSRDSENRFINKPFAISLFGIDKCF